MKKIFAFIVLFILINININAQNGSHLKVIAGVRVNPLIVYNFNNGEKKEITRLHFEIGALFNKKTYISFGYTPFVNAIYNFNEYWFRGFDKKIPVSWVIAEEYLMDNKKLFIQSGPNIKLSNVGNVFCFIFTPADSFDPGMKVGAFIPLNAVLLKK